jgi:monoterpene epsilon-lactone hydrolase
VSQQQRAAVDELMRHSGLDFAGDLREQRGFLEQIMTATPLAADVTTAPGRLGAVPVVDVAIAGVSRGVVILYFHGGAYTMGSAGSVAGLLSDLARRTGARGISVDYRLAPEHPFPAALDDALAAYRGLLETDVPPSRIAMVGESAGGGLALATLVALARVEMPQPACAVVFSPGRTSPFRV